MVLGAGQGGLLLRSSTRLGQRLLRGIHSTAAPLAAEPEPVPLSKLKDSFNDATSVTYLEELEKRYLTDPGSIDRSWASFFKSLGAPLRRQPAARTVRPAASPAPPGACSSTRARRCRGSSPRRRRQRARRGRDSHAASQLRVLARQLDATTTPRSRRQRRAAGRGPIIFHCPTPCRRMAGFIKCTNQPPLAQLAASVALRAQPLT